MTQLLNDDGIVICPTDKGSGIVVMDKQEYVEKLNSEMANTNAYKKWQQTIPILCRIRLKRLQLLRL